MAFIPISRQTGKTYRVRVTDRDGLAQAMATNALLTRTCSSNGAYALSISTTNVFSFTLSLTERDLPATGDIDGDGLADLISVVNSNLYVWFSTSGYMVRCGPYTLSAP